MDVDGSGYLEEGEIGEVLKTTYRYAGIMDYNPNRAEVKSWLKMVDQNIDGKVSLDEYEEVVLKSLEKAGIPIFEGQFVI